MEPEVTASGECEVTAGAAMRGAARLVVGDREWCRWARRAVTSWERQSDEGAVGERGVLGAGCAISLHLTCAVFMLSKG